MTELSGFSGWIAITDDQRRRCTLSRHELFCLGKSGQVLERCPFLEYQDGDPDQARLRSGTDPSDAHDFYDPVSAHFAVTLNGDVIASSRLVFGGVSDNPTGKISRRFPEPMELDRSLKATEPSRLGVLKEFQTTRIGYLATLRLIGMLTQTSLEMGFTHFLMTLRYDIIVALKWFPWELYEPFDYPVSEGGSVLDEPMWPALANLGEVIVAAEDRLPPRVFDFMFEGRIDYAELPPHRPIDQLHELAKANQQKANQRLHQVRDDQAPLPSLLPITD